MDIPEGRRIAIDNVCKSERGVPSSRIVMVAGESGLPERAMWPNWRGLRMVAQVLQSVMRLVLSSAELFSGCGWDGWPYLVQTIE